MAAQTSFWFLIVLTFCTTRVSSQTGIALAFYTTGTEQGLGFRSAKDSRCAADIRIAKPVFYTDRTKNSSFSSEVSCIVRLVRMERLRFHVGLGYKADWYFPQDHRQGLVIPLGVEAFPFPFQNAGLFFESAPFALADRSGHLVAGIRTAAGFVFYFPRTVKTQTSS